MNTRTRIAWTSGVVALALAVTGTAVALRHQDASDAQPGAPKRTPLLVVGTSDVADSYLMHDVIEPGFERAYPEYDLQYTGSATGAAIASAKTGSAAALIVHAMSLENQFVADGYSAEPAGRAIFWGDYVLAGPKDDPAGVLDGGTHDIVTAFEKIARAGAEGKATFVSRGGNPGTTVQEHALWAEAAASTTTLCTVAATNGGGKSPYSSAGTCPSTIGAKGADTGDHGFPAWYRTTGLTQAANITAADACNFTGAPHNSCYVFTDRGTLQHQQETGAVSTLTLLTRDNDTSARGGHAALVNTFHAYVINPKAPGFAAIKADNLKTNVAGATALLDWITSAAGQRAIGAYQPEDPAFEPSASPKVTVHAPTAAEPHEAITISGSLTNVVPGMPALAGVTVRLEGGDTAFSATTDAEGAFAFHVSAPELGEITYRLVTDQITQTEDDALEPAFRDLLSATTTKVGPITVTSSPS
ncbi:substrate-binding domain-containing protein [Nocardioides sp.]|uniref:substrate-binding domain-containing protein n=1 Tax=Nocardioides sp. TaxID=35761 RepID=UPI00261A8F1E|nr:substrate-binding domain-containing protein [Nocardioides sp.]